MATTQHHHRRARVLTFSYDHDGEARTACLEVTASGGLRVVKCGRRKKVRGLGDAVAAVTKAVGIVPCGGCKQRQETLNRVANVGRVKQLWLRCRYILRRGK